MGKRGVTPYQRHLRENDCGPAMEFQIRLPEIVLDHLNILPGHPLSQTKSDGLEKSLLGGEADGEMLRAPLFPVAILDFSRRKYPLKQGVFTFTHKTLEARYIHNVDAGAENHPNIFSRKTRNSPKIKQGI